MATRRAADRLIVALDLPRWPQALAAARRLRGVVRCVKVGSVLFTAHGPEAIHRLRALGFQVMLDLKFHDIPNTVELSCRAAVAHRVALLTVHACAEPAMLKAAVAGVRAEAARRHLPRPLVLGVTVLTSSGRGAASRTRAEVWRRARRAMDAGCDGVVASAREAAGLRRQLGSRAKIV